MNCTQFNKMRTKNSELIFVGLQLFLDPTQFHRDQMFSLVGHENTVEARSASSKGPTPLRDPESPLPPSFCAVKCRIFLCPFFPGKKNIIVMTGLSVDCVRVSHLSGDRSAVLLDLLQLAPLLAALLVQAEHGSSPAPTTTHHHSLGSFFVQHEAVCGVPG